MRRIAGRFDGAIGAILVIVLSMTLVGETWAQSLRPQADAALQDLLRHGWIDDAQTGHVLPTHGGFAIGDQTGVKNRNDPRGVIWERAAVICALEGLTIATGDTDLRQRIQAQWRFDKSSTLPGMSAETFAVLKKTAQAIAMWRTDDTYRPSQGPVGAGFYSADWDGAGVWEETGSTANRLYVSATSAAFVFARLYGEGFR